MAGETDTSGKALAAIIIGIAGLFILGIPFLGSAAMVTGLAAALLGVWAKKEINESETLTGGGMAVTGIFLGILQLAILAFAMNP